MSIGIRREDFIPSLMFSPNFGFLDNYLTMMHLKKLINKKNIVRIIKYQPHMITSQTGDQLPILGYKNLYVNVSKNFSVSFSART